MTTLLQEFSVSYAYSVHFTESLFDPNNSLFADVIASPHGTFHAFRSRLAFIIEADIARLHRDLESQIRDYCQLRLPGALSESGICVVPGGEYCKNTPSILAKLYDFLHDERICRHSFAIVIGGGALIDAVGYAAATTHRGVRLIRVPTTVLAQNDAGIGVKNSVNAYGKKNFLGTFAPARAIINDTQFLRTLPQRDWIAGIAEAVKVALIKDTIFFGYLEKHASQLVNRDMASMGHLIRRCAQLHLDHISKGGDPFELGSSRPLDFGHWSAHKIESLSGHSIRHGEAVAIGIELDAMYSHLAGHLNREELQRVLSLFEHLGFSRWRDHLSLLLTGVHLESALDEFKEHLGGTLHITLLKGVGSAFDAHEIHHDLMRDAINRVVQLPRPSQQNPEKAA